MHIQPAGEGLTDKACPPEPVGDFTGLYTAAGMNDTGLLTDRRKGGLKKWPIIIFRAVKRLRSLKRQVKRQEIMSAGGTY